MRPLFSLGLTLHIFSGLAVDPVLGGIIQAYGGDDRLSLAENYAAEGRQCVVGSSVSSMSPERCDPIRLFRKSPYHWREEFGLSGGGTVIKVLSRDRGEQFLQGNWFSRLIATSGGSHDKPLSREDVRLFWSNDEWSVWNFLLNSSRLNIHPDGLLETIDGRKADAFSVAVAGGVTLRYFFDTRTRLCLQRSVLRSSNIASHIVFEDYRDAGGVPFPFRMRFFDNQELYLEQDFTSVHVGATLSDGLFEIRPSPPLWVVPLWIGCSSLLVSGFVLVGLRFVRRRKESRIPGPSEVSTR
jgi:hypothetical protein